MTSTQLHDIATDISNLFPYLKMDDRIRFRRNIIKLARDAAIETIKDPSYLKQIEQLLIND